MTLDQHPFAHPSPPTHRRLPSSTSETALFRPTQPHAAEPPPAQPRKVRPFILRGHARAGKENDAAASETPTAGMRRSRTSHDIEAAASGRTAPPTAVESLRRSVRGDAGANDPLAKRRPGLSFGLAMTSGSSTLRGCSPAPDASEGRRLERQSTRAGRTHAVEEPQRRTSPRPLSLAASSLRALSSSSSSTSASRPAVRPDAPSRRISYVVPSSPSLTPTPSNTALPLAAPRAANLARSRPNERERDPSKLEQVEKHKIEMKRQMVAKRKEAVAVGATGDAPAAVSEPISVSPPPSTLPQSPVLPPTPTSLPSSVPPHAPALHTPLPVSRRRSHDGGARERKRDMYGELGLGFGSTQFDEEGDETERVGYSSLQELLERHGYAETRVITPQSTLPRPSTSATLPLPPADAPPSPTPHRTSSPLPPAETNDSLAAPAPQLRERPSLLSLRGFFSIFGGSAAEESPLEPVAPPRADDSDGSTARAADAAVLSTPPSQPRRMRTTSEMHRWVSGVNDAIARPVHPHPLSRVESSSAQTPELLFEPAPGGASDLGDEEDARSYSSSVSFELAAPRTPASDFLGAAGVGQAYLSPSWGGGGNDEPEPSVLFGLGLEATSKSASLRHTVSDSNLLPAYQSFAGLGIQVPPSPPREAAPTATGYQEPEPEKPLAPAASGRLWWAPASRLRERASQLFFSASPPQATTNAASPAPFPRSPIDVATGRSLLPASPRTPTLHSRRSQPQLLRRAISSAGLVAPATVRQIRVVAKSSRDSLGSLESCVVVGASVSGDEGEREGEVMPSWGEDLLGRRW